MYEVLEHNYFDKCKIETSKIKKLTLEFILGNTCLIENT